jgi:transcription antitermination factor NusG
MPDDSQVSAMATATHPAEHEEVVLPAAPQWHVLWTRSNCEQQVHDELVAKGYRPFLPRIGRWARRGGLRYLSRVPMFPGYLFLRHALDKAGYLDVSKVRGLVHILGDSWDRLAAVPEREIEAIRRVIDAGLPALPHPFLREGEQVRVTRGPLAGADGILLRTEPGAGRLVLSVDLLRRSIVVAIDCTEVVPI